MTKEEQGFPTPAYQSANSAMYVYLQYWFLINQWDKKIRSSKGKSPSWKLAAKSTSFFEIFRFIKEGIFRTQSLRKIRYEGKRNRLKLSFCIYRARNEIPTFIFSFTLLLKDQNEILTYLFKHNFVSTFLQSTIC